MPSRTPAVRAEDTAAGDPDASLPEITERKVKPDGSVREFRCLAVHLSRQLAVVRFVVEDPALFNTPVTIPPGTVSDGWFWPRRSYAVYRMRQPGGPIVAHRFDAVRNVVISDAEVRYDDLVLDWWAVPNGELIEEDREELAALVGHGAVDAGFEAAANAAARTVLGRYRHIIDELGKLERRLHLPLP